jgi:hypothetical protein
LPLLLLLFLLVLVLLVWGVRLAVMPEERYSVALCLGILAVALHAGSKPPLENTLKTLLEVALSSPL